MNIHEELLAKIEERHWKLFNFNYQDQSLDAIEFRKAVLKNTQALRAVVELPIEDNSKPDSFNMNFANRSPNEIAAQCFQWGYATAMNKVIQAIEKELQ